MICEWMMGQTNVTCMKTWIDNFFSERFSWSILIFRQFVLPTLGLIMNYKKLMFDSTKFSAHKYLFLKILRFLLIHFQFYIKLRFYIQI